MEISVQAKLLRTLETHTISSIGSNEEQLVDVRVVATTHRDLLALVAAPPIGGRGNSKSYAWGSRATLDSPFPRLASSPFRGGRRPVGQPFVPTDGRS
jgi:sigma54-dependent transcription regulator